ncbi:unnamed protein product [Pleuronectes platessa]|uniref:Uncharacterized protein n=1 Tax=Pleuronectes platessa TaxID=8262 RepID=A0A9N7TZR4_PLEPL|nr:unnamed protein product [Pleuronectes platessa]
MTAVGLKSAGFCAVPTAVSMVASPLAPLSKFVITSCDRTHMLKNVARPQNSDQEDSEASLHHLQDPKVFGRHGGLIEGAHPSADHGAGGGPENRSPEKQAVLRGGGAPEPPGQLHAHLRDGDVQHGGVPAEARRLHTAARPPGHERESTELLIRKLPFQSIQLARRIRRA